MTSSILGLSFCVYAAILNTYLAPFFCACDNSRDLLYTHYQCCAKALMSLHSSALLRFRKSAENHQMNVRCDYCCTIFNGCKVQLLNIAHSLQPTVEKANPMYLSVKADDTKSGVAICRVELPSSSVE